MATMGTKHVEKDVSSIEIPSWIILQSDVGLLFPSEHALDLGSVDLGRSLGDGDSAAGYARKPPSQLIVLDGTWSKAKRLFYVNPWLHNLPHHRLPPSKGSSRYGIIRKEPKPGCMSTIESIVMALEILEPETEGLDKLLDVFDYMMEDQKVCMGERYTRLEEKVRLGRSQKLMDCVEWIATPIIRGGNRVPSLLEILVAALQAHTSHPAALMLMAEHHVKFAEGEEL
ncbi:hypothetical protein R1sor_016358 [Riccia sorocarpa]|uniref:tRNA-uridine aminocarboxypropyltransferase n=1 Tax=Riccia sorocarpa TaxID=122646 RepID=A0ABD3HKZ6_9MARC